MQTPNQFLSKGRVHSLKNNAPAFRSACFLLSKAKRQFKKKKVINMKEKKNNYLEDVAITLF
jgi:hypothetical protein